MGEEEREPGTYCSRMHQVSLVTCILLRYTKITVNFCLPAETVHCIVLLPVGTHTGGFEVKNNIALTVIVCIVSFEAIGELQKERLHHSRAPAFKLEWTNTWTIPASEELSTFVAHLPSSSTRSVVGGSHLLYRRSWPCFVEVSVSVTKHILFLSNVYSLSTTRGTVSNQSIIANPRPPT